MKLVDVETRLTSWAGSPLKAVGRAGDIQKAMEQSRGVPVSPSAFLVPIGDTAQPNRSATIAVIQQVAMTFGVLLAVRDVSDAKGGQAAGTIEDVKIAVRGRLVGWSPAPEDDLVELIGGGLVQLMNGTIWWLERYRTGFQLRVT
ncbi:phage tail terminator protein [Hypericibacter sp.]|uniref:phage tail terminator protein n=1 Tax=Hypericibacter sp. TaxID=2705401 RepID=UPI003D6D3FBC